MKGNIMQKDTHLSPAFEVALRKTQNWYELQRISTAACV